MLCSPNALEPRICTRIWDRESDVWLRCIEHTFGLHQVVESIPLLYDQRAMPLSLPRAFHSCPVQIPHAILQFPC